MKIGDEKLNNSIDLIHLWGDSMYEIGFTLGSLMKDELNNIVKEVWEYLEE